MTKYRIVEETNGLNEVVYRVQRHNWFGWWYVMYRTGFGDLKSITHPLLIKAENEIKQLLKIKSDRKLRNQVSTKIIKQI